MTRFPKDCWTQNCKHFHVQDMSVDDYTCYYDLLEKQCDDCDEDYSFEQCPKDAEMR